jgi:hypothetical protein
LEKPIPTNCLRSSVGRAWKEETIVCPTRTLIDFNGDGLTDVLNGGADIYHPFQECRLREPDEFHVVYGTGSGFDMQGAHALPFSTSPLILWAKSQGGEPSYGFSAHSKLVDVNGDGRPDIVRAGSETSEILVSLNTGKDFTSARPWLIPDSLDADYANRDSIIDATVSQG